jgi:hypothetical protein
MDPYYPKSFTSLKDTMHIDSSFNKLSECVALHSLYQSQYGPLERDVAHHRPYSHRGHLGSHDFLGWQPALQTIVNNGAMVPKYEFYSTNFF